MFIYKKSQNITYTIIGIYANCMAVGTGGQGGGGNCPPIFCQPKKFKSLTITTYKSVYSNKDKIGF